VLAVKEPGKKNLRFFKFLSKNLFWKNNSGLMGGDVALTYGLLHLLGSANACLNPFLYGYLNENFRREYKTIYRKMPWYSQSQPNPSSVVLLVR